MYVISLKFDRRWYPSPITRKLQIKELYFKPGNKTDLMMIIMINMVLILVITKA